MSKLRRKTQRSRGREIGFVASTLDRCQAKLGRLKILEELSKEQRLTITLARLAKRLSALAAEVDRGDGS